VDRLFTFLVPFSTPISKLSFPKNLSLHNRLSVPQADLLELRSFVAWQPLAAVDYGRLSLPSWMVITDVCYLIPILY